MRNLLLIISLTAGIFSTSVQAGNVKVLSAVVKNKTINDAQVIWQRNGEASQQATTSADGKAAFPSSLPNDADTSMIITKPNYSTLVVKCPCDNLTYALSPVMQNLDGLRVVLTWGESPRDLDSHLAYPQNYVYFNHKNAQDAALDVDDTDSYGPETITITKKHNGERYVYAVHDYTNGSTDKKNSNALSFSQARVEVYVGQTMIRSYRVKPDTVATSWVIFGIDEDGAFHDINQYISLSRKGLVSYLNNLIEAPSFEDHSLITSAIKQDAKRINTQGESIYQQKQYEQAMYKFQDAINMYPSYGQAYSNLGLTYMKLNRNAEALWANKKAIELADGSSKARVQASSYYNIAKIYEKSGDWQEALNNYTKAKSLREHSAYDSGIERMKNKLQGL